MNVLVYSGPEVLQTSFKNTVSTLRTILNPYYTVQAVDQTALASHPWTPACALLVFPACYDLNTLDFVPKIVQYIENGGSLLHFSAGALFTRGIGLNISGLTQSRSLRFQNAGTCMRPQFGGILSSHSSILQLASGETIHHVPQTWPTTFEGVEDAKNVDILARVSGEIAAIRCDLSKGQAAIWGPSIESSLDTTEPSALSWESKRKGIISDTLERLGLHIPSPTTVLQPTPQILLGCPWGDSNLTPCNRYIVSRLNHTLFGGRSKVFEDTNNVFHFHDISETEPTSSSTSVESKPTTSHVLQYHDGELPPSSRTPLFDVREYFQQLVLAREAQGLSKGEPWGMGEALFYGEVITSTQTMLYDNPKFMSALLTPILSLASQQISGRGRGANVWLSPIGCLQFSLLLRTSSAMLPPSKLVFVQYLFGLAVVEACREEVVLGRMGEAVRLKWPNDIYAMTGNAKEDKKKIGGILVNVSFTGEDAQLVIGCGLNVLNPHPFTSLKDLRSDNTPAVTMERTMAAILGKFEAMWETFLVHRGSFQPFMDLYLKRWLHSDQLATVMASGKDVRITGITPEHGLLRTVPLAGGGFIDLQPDGNSFDIMAGIIKPKFPQ